MTETVTCITDKKRRSLRRVINTTGVVLHTSPGRANLSDKARENIMDVVRNYTNLEYGVERGSRGSHHDHVEEVLAKVTGTEATMVVNNNTTVTILCLSVLVKDEEIIVPKGELVGIGDSFRMPEIMEQSGARLMDVGTTSKTKPSDYLNVYHEGKTSALMKVHTSNYGVPGFTQEAELSEMAELGKRLNLPIIYDMGSGFITDLTDCGVDGPTVLDALKTGIDVVLFSRDKLLDGPRSGTITGEEEYIDKMKAYPLTRAFRMDKMMLAATEATFFEYSDIHQAQKTVPVLNMIATPAAEPEDKAEGLTGEICRTTHHFIMEVEARKDQIGDGPALTVLLDGYAVTVQDRTLAPEKIEHLLRKEETPAIIRITHDRVYLDVGTVREDESECIVVAFTAMDSRQIEG